MTPKEASIEIEQAIALIYHALNRNTNNATWRDLNDALVHIRKIRAEFISPARNKSKPRHPPKVPAVPERIELINPRKYGFEPNIYVGKKTHEPDHDYLYSISSCARPLGRLE